MFHDLLKSGRTLVGSICMAPSAFTAEIMARSGFDWLFVDQQHGLAGRETIVDMLRAIEIVGTPTLVRAPWNRPELVGWALDAGAHGVISPMVNTAAEAEALVSACRFGPKGSRSWGPLRALLSDPDYGPQKGDRAVVCPMIETAEAIANLDAILAVEGVDVVLIGQSDLCISFGLHPSKGRTDGEHKTRLRRIADGCNARGVPSIVNCTTAAEAKELLEVGFRHLMVDSDYALLRRSASAAAKDVKNLLG